MHYDLIVLGGGPAGYLAAERAAHAGKRVLCVEQEHLGGVCLNEGCIPTKTLLYSAKLFDGVKYGAKYGVTAESEAVSIAHPTVMARKNKVVKTLVGGIKAMLKAKGVTVINGKGTILGKSPNGIEVAVGENTYTGENLIIATGSSPIVPPIPGLAEAQAAGTILTNREILELPEIPKRLVVVGGGVIGLEMASYFNSCGSHVTVVEMLDHIAGDNDVQMSEILKKNYAKKGIEFMLSTRAARFEEKALHCEAADGTASVLPFDYALISVGRRANTGGIGLEALGVATERGAIVTDAQMRTNIENVYAAGDVNGKSMLAHTAYRESEVAINTILGKADEIDYLKIPSVVYTNPEMASIGLTQAKAEEKGLNTRTVTLNMRYAGRYLAENEGGDGIFKLVVNNDNNKILGAQALCNYASEFIVSIGVMMEAQMTLEQVQRVVFPHPTVCEIIREAVFI